MRAPTYRRNALSLLFILVLIACYLPGPVSVVRAKGLIADDVRNAQARVVTIDNGIAAPEIKVVREWNGLLCRSRIVHEGKVPVRIKEIVLFDIPHGYPLVTHLYGEGFTMLSQTGGTIIKPVDMGLTDRNHYKIPQPSDATTVHGLLTLSPPKDKHALFAFTSCRRFVGRFDVRSKSIQVVVDAESLTLAPGQSWDLEEFMFNAGTNRLAMLANLAERISVNHRPPRPEDPPTGWCSWYCFGPRVKAEQVLANANAIRKTVPDLKY